MNHRGPIARSFAILLAVVVPLVCIPQTSAQDSATLAGTIFSADGEALVDGAILHAGDLRTGDIYSSTKTGPDGEFVISDLPPAAYELAIERDGGLYLVGSSVQLAAGEQRQVYLALAADAAPDPATVNNPKKRIWDKPLWATLFVVGGAFIVGYGLSAADNRSASIIASPFQLTN